MKKLLSIIIMTTLVFSSIAMQCISVSAETVTIANDDKSIWCYIGGASLSANSADEIYYASETTDAENNMYATASEALDAAFTDYGAKAYKHPNAVYLNQNAVLTSPYTINDKGADLRLNIDTYRIIYQPILVDDIDAFPITFSDTRGFIIYSNSTANGQSSFYNVNGEKFFDSSKGKTITFQSGNFNGDINVNSLNSVFNTKVYGNINYTSSIAFNRTLNIRSTVTGNVNCAQQNVCLVLNKPCIINGDVTSDSIRVSDAGTIINGNVDITQPKVANYGYGLKALSGITVNGNISAHGNDLSQNLHPLDATNLIVSGSVTIDGITNPYEYTNCSFKGGFYNKTSNHAIFTFDETDTFGVNFYANDAEFESTLLPYNTKASLPANLPTKDGYTFTGWFTSDNKKLSESDLVVDNDNEFFADFKIFAPKTITVTTDDYYLPQANMLASESEKTVCYKDSQNNIVKCGSKATKGETYTAVTINIKMLSGACVRIKPDGVNGIRFLTDVSTADIENLKLLGYEIEELGTNITPDKKENQDDFANVIAKSFFETNEKSSIIAGSIANILDENLTRNFCGRGYIVLKNAENNDTVTVSAVYNDNLRCIYNIANKANSDTDANYTTKQKAVITDYLNSVVIINNGMIETSDDYSTPYVYTGEKLYAKNEIKDNIKLVVKDGEKYYNGSENSLSDLVTSSPTNDEIHVRFDYFSTMPTGSASTLDTCVLMLPTTYTENGRPTRLILEAHGYGSAVREGTVTESKYQWSQLMLHEGYAVLEVQALSPSHMGSPVASNAYITAYEQVMKNYNFYTDGIFLSGTSMGGITSINALCADRMPVLAHVLHSPVTSLFRQAYCVGWMQHPQNNMDVANNYKFDYAAYNEKNLTSYTKTNFPFFENNILTDSAVEFYEDNFYDKVAVDTSIWKYCSQFYDYDNKTFKEGYTDYLTARETDAAHDSAYSNRVEEIYNTISIDYPVPVLILHGTKDVAVNYIYSKYLAEAINRGNGEKAQLNLYDQSMHSQCFGKYITKECYDGYSLNQRESCLVMLDFVHRYEPSSEYLQ